MKCLATKSARFGESGWVDMNRYEAGVGLRQLLFDGFGTDSEVSRQYYRVESSAFRTMDTAQAIALRAIERRDVICLFAAPETAARLSAMAPAWPGRR